MTQRESGPEAGDESVRTEWGRESPGSVFARRARGALRWGLESGTLAGVAGGASVLSGLRALARGNVGRGLVRLVVGALLLAVASLQRGPGARPTGERIDVGEPTRVTIGEPVPGAYERLGAAAFDEYSAEVPVPQVAFDRRFLSLGSEVHWGVREADDAVVLSASYDAVEDADGVDYVASSQIDDERVLSVPDRVLDHWDDASGGPVAVESGTEMVFATAEDPDDEALLVVVPERWVEDVLGERDA